MAGTEDELVLLTHDTEFLDVPSAAGRAIVSRVAQRPPIARRVELWCGALGVVSPGPALPGRQMPPTGEVVAWETL